MNIKLLKFILIITFGVVFITLGILMFKNRDIEKKNNSTSLNITETKSELTITPTPLSNARKIVAFGDSLTEGFGVRKSQSYPSLLKEKLKDLGYVYDVINLGNSGDTTSDGLRRLNSVVAQKPEIVIVEFGANDVFRKVEPKIIRENLSKIIEELKKENTKIILSGLETIPKYNTKYHQEVANIYPELAKKYDLLLIPSFLEEVQNIPELNIADGMHPNSKGYQIILEKNIWPVLEKALEK